MKEKGHEIPNKKKMYIFYSIVSGKFYLPLLARLGPPCDSTFPVFFLSPTNVFAMSWNIFVDKNIYC